MRSQLKFTRTTVRFRHNCSAASPEKSKKGCCGFLNSYVRTSAFTSPKVTNSNEFSHKVRTAREKQPPLQCYAKARQNRLHRKNSPSRTTRKRGTDGKSYRRPSADQALWHHTALLVGRASWAPISGVYAWRGNGSSDV